jgi:hypothetical protein
LTSSWFQFTENASRGEVSFVKLAAALTRRHNRRVFLGDLAMAHMGKSEHSAPAKRATDLKVHRASQQQPPTMKP